MADITPYEYGDAADSNRERFEDQQIAEAMTASRTSDGRRTVERVSPLELLKVQDALRQRRLGANRFGIVHTQHGRRD